MARKIGGEFGLPDCERTANSLPSIVHVGGISLRDLPEIQCSEQAAEIFLGTWPITATLYRYQCLYLHGSSSPTLASLRFLYMKYCSPVQTPLQPNTYTTEHSAAMLLV